MVLVVPVGAMDTLLLIPVGAIDTFPVDAMETPPVPDAILIEDAVEGVILTVVVFAPPITHNPVGAMDTLLPETRGPPIAHVPL